MGSVIWIPAFAGMTGGLRGRDLSLLFMPDFGRRAWLSIIRIPAFAGMTGAKGKGFVARDSYFVSGNGLGFNHLDSRLRGNDGG